LGCDVTEIEAAEPLVGELLRGHSRCGEPRRQPVGNLGGAPPLERILTTAEEVTQGGLMWVFSIAILRWRQSRILKLMNNAVGGYI
jgi:hypothetical protein